MIDGKLASAKLACSHEGLAALAKAGVRRGNTTAMQADMFVRLRMLELLVDDQNGL
jgi:hypothetical protein